MKKRSIVFGTLSVMLMSCGTQTNNVNIPNPEVQEVAEIVEKVTEEPADIIDVAASKIGFGAFKTTDKVEVKGWFKSFTIDGVNQEGSNWKEALSGAWVTIDVPSLETKDTSRNAKIIKHFFGSTSSDLLIGAKVLSIDSSLAVLEIDFNGIKKPVDFNVSMSNDTLNLTSSIDVADFDATNAVAAINKACEALHKGADGVSKTWSEVNLYVSTVVNSQK